MVNTAHAKRYAGEGGVRRHVVLPLGTGNGYTSNDRQGSRNVGRRTLTMDGTKRNATFRLHGAVKDFGYFYSSLYLGTPAKKFSVIVDTGSTMTYVPCSTCGHGCGPNHQKSAFDPTASSTCASISCHSLDCKCGSPLCACSNREECMYTRSYAEQSTSSGILMEDVLSIHDDGPGIPIKFGCETRETGEIFKQQADGLLGLGKSEGSLVQQLVDKSIIDNQFSLCFGLVEGEGALILGKAPALMDVTLGYTPMVDSPTNENYYTLEMKSIHVNGIKLGLDPTTFSTGYSTVLDSGTTFTYLPTKAFHLFAEYVSSHAFGRGLFSVPGPDPEYKDICFGGATSHDDLEGLKKLFPLAKFTFKGGVELELSPLQYLFVHTFNSGKYCLGIFDNGNAGILLGGITFRNVLVQYDVARNRIGFGKASCKELGIKYRPPCSHFAHMPKNTALEAFTDGDCEPDNGELEESGTSREELILPDESMNKKPIIDDQESTEHATIWVFIGWAMLISLILTVLIAVKKTTDILLRMGYHPVNLSSMDPGATSPRGGAFKIVKSPEDPSKSRHVQYISLIEMHAKNNR